MADWPDADELKQVLDIDSDDWDETVDRVLAAAIQHVKDNVGDWDSSEDSPDDALAQAALRMAELMAQRPNAVPGVLAMDPTYQRLIYGHRHLFGIA